MVYPIVHRAIGFPPSKVVQDPGFLPSTVNVREFSIQSLVFWFKFSLKPIHWIIIPIVIIVVLPNTTPPSRRFLDITNPPSSVRFSRSGGCSAGQPQHSGLVPTSWGQALAGEDSEKPWVKWFNWMVHSDGEVIEGSLEDSMDRLMNGGYIEIPD